MEIKLARADKAREVTLKIARAGNLIRPDATLGTMLCVEGYLGDIGFVRGLLASRISPLDERLVGWAVLQVKRDEDVAWIRFSDDLPTLHINFARKMRITAPSNAIAVAG